MVINNGFIVVNQTPAEEVYLGDVFFVFLKFSGAHHTALR